MSEYSKILSACGWIEDFEELPLIAERIARHSAQRIDQLESCLRRVRNSIDECNKLENPHAAFYVMAMDEITRALTGE